MECNKRDAYHVGKHSKPTPPLAHVIFYLFIYFLFIEIIKWQIEFPEGFSLFSLFSFVFE